MDSKETSDELGMIYPHRSKGQQCSWRSDISFWHLFAIYGLLTLSIVMGMLSLVSLHHLNRRQIDVEMRLDISSSSSNSEADMIREPASEASVMSLHEQDVPFAESEDTDASQNGLPESGKESQLGSVWHRNRRDAGPVLSPERSSEEGREEEGRERNSVELPSSEPQSTDEGLTSVPNGLSSTSESSTTNLIREVHRTRHPREARDREGGVMETVSVRGQGNNSRSNRTQKPPKNRRPKQKPENESGTQGLVAIHLHAPETMSRQYESGPMVSLNASDTRDTVYRFWRKASWVRESVSEVFHLDEPTGHVTVEIEGVYMIYAQVVYHDLSGRWSYGIYVGDQERVKCLATEQLRDLQSYHPTSHGVYQSCYTSLVLYIRKNQSVSIRCMYGSRTILTRPEFTFWGMVRLS